MVPVPLPVPAVPVSHVPAVIAMIAMITVRTGRGRLHGPHAVPIVLHQSSAAVGTPRGYMTATLAPKAETARNISRSDYTGGGYHGETPYLSPVNARGHNRGMRRWLVVVLGIILVLIGAVWTLQGANFLGGSFMTGSRTWLAIGLVVLVAGAALLVRSLRPRPGRR